MNRLVRIMFANTGTKIMALVLAGLTWILMFKTTMMTDEIEYPVKILPPQNVKVLHVTGLYSRPGLEHYVMVTLQGSRSALAETGEQRVARYVIDKKVEKSERIEASTFRGLDFNLAPNLELKDVDPETFAIVVDKIVDKRLRVKVAAEGDLASDYRLASQLRAIPSEVTVRGPASVLAGYDEISTQPINLAGRSESFTAKNVSIVGTLDAEDVPNVGTLKGVKVTAAETVTVDVVIEPETVTIQKTVTFDIRALPGFGDKYHVRLLTPYDNFEFQVLKPLAVKPEALVVGGFVDLRDSTEFPGPGDYPVTVQFDLPDGVAYTGEPVVITVTLEAREETGD